MIESKDKETTTSLVRRVLTGALSPVAHQWRDRRVGSQRQLRAQESEELKRLYHDAQAVYDLLGVQNSYIDHSVSMSQCPLCRNISLLYVEVNLPLDLYCPPTVEVHSAHVCSHCYRVIKISRKDPVSA